MDVRGKLLLILTLLSSVSITRTQTYAEMDTLVTSLLTGYNKDIRPLNDQSQRIAVSIFMAPGAITKFNAADESISMTSVIIVSWQDERISWTPSAHGNINSVLLSKENVWFPLLMLADPADDVETLGKTLSIHVEYTSTGVATLTAGMLVESLCEVDVTNWPFDTQECEIRFASLNYDNRSLTITAGEVSFLYYTEDGEYEVVATHSSSYLFGHTPVAAFKFSLKRRPTFLIVNIILPVIFLMILSVFVFFLPAESGERVGYSLTVLLSISVFLGVVNQFLPTTSKSISNLTYYLMINFILSTCICIGTMISLRFHSKTKEESLPNWIRLVFRRCSRSKRVSPEITEVVSYDNQGKLDSDEEQVAKQVDNEDELTWKDVAKLFDTSQFIFFSLAIITTILWVFLFSALRS